MKRKLYQLIPLIGLCLMIEGCQPDVDELTIESCLLSKIDNLELLSTPINVNGQDAFIISPSSSASVFSYDKSNRPITFSYYSNSSLTGYTEVTYNSDGTLKGGTNYSSSKSITGTIEYLFNTDKQLTQQTFKNAAAETIGFMFYSYTDSKLPNTVIQIDVDRTTSVFEGRKYRFEYDNKNNLKTRYSKYLTRSVNTDPDFANKFLTDLDKSKEFVNIALSDYDDMYNPYRSQPTLAILFDQLPSFNNARKITFSYVNTGEKYAESIYTFQYNRKGFPYIYTEKIDYTTEYTQWSKLQDNSTTSSYEYQCK